MAFYKLYAVVEGARLDSVKAKIRKTFGEDATLFAVEKKVEPESRQERFDEAYSRIDEAKSDMEELKDEMQQWYDSIPENLRNGEKANEVQECIDNLETMIGDLENLDSSSISFPGMF